MSNTYVVVDIETSGLSAAHLAEVVEVAAFKTDGTKIIDEFHQYIKPWKPMSKAATEVNHITDEMLKDKPNKWKVLPQLRQFIGDSIFVAHNAQFDFTFLNLSFFQIDIPMMHSYICTLTNYRKFNGSSKKSSLSAVCETLGIELVQAHSAYADARATVDVFHYLLANTEFIKVQYDDKEVLEGVLKRLASGNPHKSQTTMMTSVPKVSGDVELTEADVISQFRMGKTPNEICETSTFNYENAGKLFRQWMNNIRCTKFFSLMNDKKLTKEVKAMISVCKTFEELLELHDKVFGKPANLSLYSLFWALEKNVGNMSYYYQDFEWHFMQQKNLIDIGREFSVSPFLVADFFVEFAEKNKDEYRGYIARNICGKTTLVDILRKRDYINTLSKTPSSLDVKKYLTKKLYDRGFFLIDLSNVV